MGNFGETFIYPNIHSFSTFYCRFTDDIFFLWNVTLVQLQEFNNGLNNPQHTIKVDFKYFKPSTEFLDIAVYRNKEQNKLLTTIYSKATDQTNFLQ